MASMYYHGKRVSAPHHAVLSAYERKYGVAAQVNQGERTLAEQTYFWNLYKSGRGNLAAFPSPTAPHIKAGHVHHALDINAGGGKGQAQHVAAFYKSLGIPVAFNVNGEPWHMDTTDEAALKRAAAKLGGATGEPVLRQGRSGPSVVRLKKLLYNKGIRNFSGAKSSNRYNPYFGKYTKDAVKRFQKANGLTADGVAGAATWRALHED